MQNTLNNESEKHLKHREFLKNNPKLTSKNYFEYIPRTFWGLDMFKITIYLEWHLTGQPGSRLKVVGESSRQNWPKPMEYFWKRYRKW